MLLPNAFTLPGVTLGVIYSGAICDGGWLGRLRCAGVALGWAACAAVLDPGDTRGVLAGAAARGYGSGRCKALCDDCSGWAGECCAAIIAKSFASAALAVAREAAPAYRRHTAAHAAHPSATPAQRVIKLRQFIQRVLPQQPAQPS